MTENEIAKVIACDLRLALVINFGERQVRQGIHRVVNGLQE
jgi:hypothetical protein